MFRPPVCKCSNLEMFGLGLENILETDTIISYQLLPEETGLKIELSIFQECAILEYRIEYRHLFSRSIEYDAAWKVSPILAKLRLFYFLYYITTSHGDCYTGQRLFWALLFESWRCSELLRFRLRALLLLWNYLDLESRSAPRCAFVRSARSSRNAESWGCRVWSSLVGFFSSSNRAACNLWLVHSFVSILVSIWISSSTVINKSLKFINSNIGRDGNYLGCLFQGQHDVGLQQAGQRRSRPAAKHRRPLRMSGSPEVHEQVKNLRVTEGCSVSKLKSQGLGTFSLEINKNKGFISLFYIDNDWLKRFWEVMDEFVKHCNPWPSKTYSFQIHPCSRQGWWFPRKKGPRHNEAHFNC